MGEIGSVRRMLHWHRSSLQAAGAQRDAQHAMLKADGSTRRSSLPLHRLQNLRMTDESSVPARTLGRVE